MIVSHLESCTPGTRQYMTVCTGMYQYVPYSVHGGTRNLKMVHTSTYQHWKFLWQYILVCTGMYCLVPAQYKVVQDGTWWYRKVHGSTMNGTRRYMKVQDGTYWHVLIRSVQSGYAFPLNLLLQFCPADSSVLEISASIHTSASASKIQSNLELALVWLDAVVSNLNTAAVSLM